MGQPALLGSCKHGGFPLPRCLYTRAGTLELHFRTSCLTADAFLDVIEVPRFQTGTLRDRSKTAVAGAIMTAVLNAGVVAFSGYQA